MHEIDDRVVDVGKTAKVVPVLAAALAVAAIVPWLLSPHQHDARWAIGIAAFIIYPIALAAIILLSVFLIRKGLVKRGWWPLVATYWGSFGIFVTAAIYACSGILTN